jgi:hypothetical protein
MAINSSRHATIHFSIFFIRAISFFFPAVSASADNCNSVERRTDEGDLPLVDI